MGRKATQYVKSVIRAGDRVEIELDVGERDRYGRLLGYVWLPDGRMLNEEIVRAGYASLIPVINDLIITQKVILSDVFEGGILVNTIRFVGSVFIFFLALLGTAFAARAGSKIRDRYLEKKMLAYFSSYFESIDKKYFRSMIELFLGTEGSLDKLKKIRDSLYDDDKIENVAEYIKGLNKIHVEAKAHVEQQKKDYENLPVPEHAHQLTVVLGRFWKETDGKMRIDKGIISPLNLLIELVQERKVPFGAHVGAKRILYAYINKVEKPDFKLVSY